jgi:HlyD family secretion protein
MKAPLGIRIFCNLAVPVVLACSACSEAPQAGYQGYVEGEYVAMASSIGGRLEVLGVKSGDSVRADTALFQLESVNEAAGVRQAREQLKAAQAQLADMQQGRRLPEQQVTQAMLAQAEAETQRSATQLARDEAQLKIGGISQAQLDDVRAAHSANLAKVAQFRSELAVARLPGRRDLIDAQAAQVAAANAALEQADWRLAQKSVASGTSALVVDTLYTQGEWVPAGSPVVRLLPPGNLKLRFFVPETQFSALSVGQSLSIECDGCGDQLKATLTYLSTEAEYTPPVIYSNATRGKLVFMAEARPNARSAARLHPGQPVSVRLQ